MPVQNVVIGDFSTAYDGETQYISANEINSTTNDEYIISAEKTVSIEESIDTLANLIIRCPEGTVSQSQTLKCKSLKVVASKIIIDECISPSDIELKARTHISAYIQTPENCKIEVIPQSDATQLFLDVYANVGGEIRLKMNPEKLPTEFSHVELNAEQLKLVEPVIHANYTEIVSGDLEIQSAELSSETSIQYRNKLNLSGRNVLGTKVSFKQSEEL